MPTSELRNRLIEKIQSTNDEGLLEEAYRLLEAGFDDIEIYKINDAQTSAINEARTQIMNGQFLTEEQANNEIDEWLNK